MNKAIIRLETKENHREVENLVRDSFWNVYRPGCYEHFVLKKLRDDPCFVPELDLVMFLVDENTGKEELIGQNMFMKTDLALDNGEKLPIMTMGPICIANKYKRQGYGKLLLDYSLEQAAKIGCKGLCFEGNIDFYGKSGFVEASTKNIRYHGLPEGADASFFLCKELQTGYFDDISGEYATPEGYFAAEKFPEEFKDYESSFPYKEKKVLPGQLGK